MVVRIRRAGVSRRRVVQGIGAAGVVGITGFPAIAETRPIRFGWIAAVTGIFATNALAQDYGCRMGVEDINKAGGLLGRQIEIFMRDSAADPGKAVGFAKELVFNQDVDVVGGPLNSGETLPTLNVVAGARKLHIIEGSIDELVDPVKYPLMFRGLNTNGQWLKVGVNFGIDQLKKTRVAIINDNTGYGVLARDAVIKVLAGRGLKPAYTATVDANKTDLTDEVNKARDAGADCIQMWSNATGFQARVLNARGEQKWDVPVVAHPTLLQEAVANLLTKRAYWENAYATGYKNALLDANDRLPPLTQGFLDRHKDTAGPYLAAGISAFLQGNGAPLIYAAGVNKAGGTDAAAIAAALETIPVIETPFGPFSYSPTNHNGYQDDGIVMMVASSGKNNGWRAAQVA